MPPCGETNLPSAEKKKHKGDGSLPNPSPFTVPLSHDISSKVIDLRQV